MKWFMIYNDWHRSTTNQRFTPREFESGSLMVGSSLNFGMVIPPAQAQWSATGHCPAGCLVEGMPESGIKVYQILPHAHIIGT